MGYHESIANLVATDELRFRDKDDYTHLKFITIDFCILYCPTYDGLITPDTHLSLPRGCRARVHQIRLEMFRPA